MTDNVLKMLVITRDATTQQIKVYIDGVLKLTSTDTGNLLKFGVNPIWLFQAAGINDDTVAGYVKYVGVWNRVLTLAEVVAISPSAALSRVGWVLTGSGTVFGSVGETVDGDLYSGWSPGAPVGAWFRIDTLASRQIGACKFNAHGSYPTAMPRTGNIETSTDGVTFAVSGSWVQADISGAAVTIQWTPVTARYVKIVPTSVCVNSGDAWLTSEVNLYATYP